jgi:hypothetical protein
VGTSLLGYATGVGVAVAYRLVLNGRLGWPLSAVVLGGLAMAASNAPMTALGITDPRQWTLSDWAADVVPHLAYGAAAAATVDRLR